MTQVESGQVLDVTITGNEVKGHKIDQEAFRTYAPYGYDKLVDTLLDRTDGKLLMAKPLVKKLTWAKEIGPDGRPVMNPNQTPTAEGNLICPAVEGAANFFSTSYNPATGLFYVNTLEKCAIYSKRALTDWQAGRGYAGGGGRRVPDEKAQKFLRAFDIKTGKVKEAYCTGGIQFSLLVEALERHGVDEKLQLASQRAIQCSGCG
jgi:hypothetical protein